MDHSFLVLHTNDLGICKNNSVCVIFGHLVA